MPLENETNDIRERLQEIARTIAILLPPGTGFALLAFALLAFDLGDHPGSRLEYVANGRREDIVKAMKEFIAHAETSFGQHN